MGGSKFKKVRWFVAWTLLLMDSVAAWAIQDTQWVTTTKKKVYGRVGPGKRYPIKAVYETPFLPFKILAVVGEWLKVSDFENDELWFHQTMVSTKAPVFLVTASNCFIRRKPYAPAPYGSLQQGAVLRVRKCKGGLCEGFIREHEGWFDPLACGGFGATPGWGS